MEGSGRLLSEPRARLRPRAARRRGPGSDLPSAAAQQWNALATGANSRHRDVIAADHEVDGDLALVDPLLIRLAFDGEAEALAQRDVAGGVLVEQRVVEDGLERPDPA